MSEAENENGETTRVQRAPAKVWYSTREAADMLGLAPQTIRSLVFRGKIKPDHRGNCGDGLKSHRFHIDTINAFLGRKAG